MNLKAQKGVRTWIEIDRKALAKNIGAFRKLIGNTTKLCGVVKSNAYGHGLVGFSKELEQLAVDWLAVDSVSEGLRLRREGIKTPILILGYTLPEKLPEAAASDLSVTISHFEGLEELRKLRVSEQPHIHIKVDTGMHRQGFMLHDAARVIELLKILSLHKVQGLYTHFATSKDPAEPDYTKKQIAEFNEWSKVFEVAGFTLIRHAAATAGAILFPEARFDMVRIGAGMYGLWPSQEVQKYAEKKIQLKPVLSWRTIISEVKLLFKGESIGYDLTTTLDRNSRIAICPIGYWHGFPRSLSKVGTVIVQEVCCGVLGRVSMDMIVIDVTDVKGVQVGDVVTLIGKDGGEYLGPEDMARITNSSRYEIITRINPLILKLYQ